ncbi:cutinase, partial [Eremomyces bilateralis CBS 781.70]
SCTPYRVIYAKGTTEMGELGFTVGPSLSSGLSGRDFTVDGVDYPADMDGINCLGMEGGIIAMKMLENAVAQCPEQKIFMSGYSQGAMVAREAVAFARPEARKQVIGVVTFGDPFNGSPIADFDSSKIKIFCSSSDGVCKGEFSISLGHLGYVGTSTTQAVSWIKQQAR